MVGGIEALPPPLDPRQSIEEAIAASVARTAFMGLGERIRPFTPEELEQGNQEVQRRFENEARGAILLPDALILPGPEVVIIPNRRTRELLGLLILKRSLEPTSWYLESGFFSDAGSSNSRRQTMKVARKELRKIVGSQDEPLVHTDGKGTDFRWGIDDVIFIDARPNPLYTKARRAHSAELWRAHILDEKAKKPEPSEDAVMWGAYDTLEQAETKDLSISQRGRLLRLTENVEQWINSHTSRQAGKAKLSSNGTPPVHSKVSGIKPQSNQYPDDEGLCLSLGKRGEDLFFTPDFKETEKEKRSRETRAKAICNACPIKATCLQGALKRREKHGIWGGTTPEERQRMIREQRLVR